MDYAQIITGLGYTLNDILLARFKKNLALVISNGGDGALVSKTDPEEVNRVIAYFAKKEYCTDEDKVRAALDTVFEKYNANQKQRVVVYYALAVELGCEAAVTGADHSSSSAAAA